ncbi:hypothetical protein DFH94DRAFT_474535 [Russula ochroleuca]|uniref:Uncharacterized protein n=1 Tax=Russula ochroleuca TaxID=152965 RepID=A0A9P5T9E9_9AGAM|nr:hypothetical protein DFH94DRAFT_474535 [Russula ochroleuca]
MSCPPRMALGMFPRSRKVQSRPLSARLRLFGLIPLIPGRGAALVPFHPRLSRQYHHHHLNLYSRLLASVSASGWCLPMTFRVPTRPRSPETLSGFTHQSRNHYVTPRPRRTWPTESLLCRRNLSHHLLPLLWLLIQAPSHKPSWRQVRNLFPMFIVGYVGGILVANLRRQCADTSSATSVSRRRL